MRAITGMGRLDRLDKGRRIFVSAARFRGFCREGVHQERPVLPESTHLVIDVHSHGTMKAFFSSTDDFDDSGGVRLSVVLGSYSRNEGRHNFLYKCRAVLEGFFFDLEVDP